MSSVDLDVCLSISSQNTVLVMVSTSLIVFPHRRGRQGKGVFGKLGLVEWNVGVLGICVVQNGAGLIEKC